jgi:hypothetical protein
VKCGHCKDEGALITIAHVKTCAGFSTLSAAAPERPLLPRSERPLLRDQIAADKAARTGGTATLTRTQQPVSTDPVPAGRYALELPGHPDDRPSIRFYKVDRPTEGRWAGFVFLKVQAGDDEHPIKARDEKARILAAIGADIKGAMLRYGREIGACGHCGRTLTNDDSRARGIGPVCIGKMGWAA